MSINLPPAIDAYIRHENLGQSGNEAAYFAAEAVVRDEGATHAGLVAIAQWRAAAKRKYDHSIEALDVTDKDGKTIVKARVSGNFPGSPVVLGFAFTLKDGKILALEIK